MKKHKLLLQLSFVFVVFVISMDFVGCGDDSSTRVSFQTGIVNGVVIFWEGDFMPGNPTGTKTPIERELYIFEETTLDMVEQEKPGPFYTSVSTKLVGVTRSNASGFFQVELPAKTYSMFVKEGEQFYANSFDGYGRIMPVEVEPDKITSIQVDITYMATF